MLVIVFASAIGEIVNMKSLTHCHVYCNHLGLTYLTLLTLLSRKFLYGVNILFKMHLSSEVNLICLQTCGEYCLE